ncbi:choice-of-anchor L domain-containing protein [Thalassotalea fusca]
MKNNTIKALTASLILSASTFANAGLVVTQNNNVNDLVDTILGGGIASTNLNSTGASNAFGTFTGGISAGIGIESGIMLSTGNVTDAVGPNTSNSTTTDFGTAGDTDLTAIAGFDTHDAAFITFDFETTTGNLFFDYVFASEEYNEFVNSTLNDVFAFFVDGVNIALIPGTDTPVSINTVNGGNPLGTDASNSQYFNNNSLQDGGPFFDIEYDGFTDVFTAKILGLSAGTHTISIGIADAGDSSYDSTVFIEAGSFSNTNPIDVPEPTTLSILALSALGLASRRKLK